MEAPVPGSWVLRLNWPCSSDDSGESRLRDFMRKFNFWRRGECGAVVVLVVYLDF